MRRAITLAILAALASPVDVAFAHSAMANDAAASPYKYVLPKGVRPDASTGAQLIQDYGSFALYRAPTPTLSSSAGAVASSPGADVLQFTAQRIDTQRGGLVPPAPFSLDVADGPALRLVQFVGPVRGAWLSTLAARGVKVVQYVASNGYVVWADEAAQAQLRALRGRESWLQYDAPFYSFLKLDPELQQRLTADPASNEGVDITVQVYSHDGDASTRRFIESKGVIPVSQQAPVGSGTVRYAWAPILKFANLSLRVRLADVATIAERPDVTFVGLKPSFTLMDAKQDVLLTGDFSPPSPAADYLLYLSQLGFPQDSAAYPIVDITDNPVDEGGSGVTVVDTADVTLHVGGDAAQPSRVAYFNNCSSTPDPQVGDISGHGTINASIIAGYDRRSGFPYQDADGYNLGLGVNPFARIGSTAIFVPGFDTSACGNSAQGLIAANWENGAKISSNSWGANPPPTTYNDTDQVYDAGVRDADPSTSGNQELIYVIAAGNVGPTSATISSPAAGKNVITVGASEGVRPTWSDGCGIGPTGADNANDIVAFSSRGPAPGGRVKPEVVAPGSHIQGSASNYAGYDGSGVCDQFHPAGQTVFAASSGTSHSTPAIAGLASLAYWWIEHGGAGAAAGSVVEVGGARAPSPALMKAWLIAHPTYLNGSGANDDLPSKSQGYGMPTLADMFSPTPKVLVDQSDVITATGDTRSYVWAVADRSQPLRIALAYTDAPGALGTSPQVNDLDLAVTVDGQTYLGNHFDHQWSTPGGVPDSENNYETVFLPAGSSDELTVTVTGRNIAADSIAAGESPRQDFALVCSNCEVVSTFTMSTTTSDVQVCAGSELTVPIALASIGGFDNPVSLAVEGVPAETAATFAPNPATPPDISTLTIAPEATAEAGQYPVTVTATSGAIAKSLALSLGLYAEPPSNPTLDSPSDAGTDVPLLPTFTWTPAAQGYDYLVQIATDAQFTHVVASTDTRDTSWTLTGAEQLESSTRYWWRVVARNACGASAPIESADAIFVDGFDSPAVVVGARSFSTVAQPGDCPVAVPPTVVFEDDMENGTGAWTHGAATGSVDGWSLAGSARSGTHAWQADAPAAGAANDSYLISPSIDLPSDLAPLTLSFWDQEAIKSLSASSCQDGAVVEVSTDGGSNWSQVSGSKLLTHPYDGPVSANFGNPLANHQAWCGDPRGYQNTIVDLQNFAGRTVKLRFRLGHDRFAHRANPNWAIDDVSVKGCSN